MSMRLETNELRLSARELGRHLGRHHSIVSRAAKRAAPILAHPGPGIAVGDAPVIALLLSRRKRKRQRSL